MKNLLWGLCGGVVAVLITWALADEPGGDGRAKADDELTSQLDELRAGLQKTNEELAQRRARDRSLAAPPPQQHQLAQAPETAEEAADTQAAAPAVDDTPAGPLLEVREKAFFQTYFSELDEKLEGEGHDDGRTLQVKDVAAKVISDDQIGELVDVQCSPTLCRIEVKKSSEVGGSLFAHRLMKRIQFGEGSVHIPTDESEIVGYFSKPGTRLPQPTIPFDTFVKGEEG